MSQETLTSSRGIEVDTGRREGPKGEDREGLGVSCAAACGAGAGARDPKYKRRPSSPLRHPRGGAELDLSVHRGVYNPRRLHSTLGCCSLDEAEPDHLPRDVPSGAESGSCDRSLLGRRVGVFVDAGWRWVLSWPSQSAIVAMSTSFGSEQRVCVAEHVRGDALALKRRAGGRRLSPDPSAALAATRRLNACAFISASGLGVRPIAGVRS